MTTSDAPKPDANPQPGNSASPQPTDLVSASPLRRLAAFLFDLVLVGAFHLFAGSGRWLFTGLVFALYHTVSLTVWGSTLGKTILALRVRASDGTRLRWLAALLRSTVGYLASGFLLLGFLRIFRDPRRRAWHDVLFGSEVVQQPGPLSVKQFIRAIDEWTEQLDAWQKQVLARYKRISGLWSLVLKLTGLMTILQGAVERVGRWTLSQIKASPAGAAPGTASAATTGAATGTSALGTATSTVTALLLAGAAVVTYQISAPPALRPWGGGLARSSVLSGECSGTISASTTRGYVGDLMECTITIKPPFDKRITRVTTNNPLCQTCDATQMAPGRFIWTGPFAGKGPFRVEFVAYDKDGEVRCRGHTTELTALGPRPQ